MVKRNTIQRTLVLDAVRRLKSHATAEEIYKYVSEVHPNISMGTVYRNLRQLAEAGDIRLVQIPGEPDRFDHICLPHYHVRCDKCGTLFDIETDTIPNLTENIKNPGGFLFTGQEITFYGVCPKCREDNN